MTEDLALCGIARLLVAVFGKPEESVFRRLGLPAPVTKRFCADCGKPISLINKTGYCQKCLTSHKYIDVACSTCGGLFKRRASEVIWNINKKGQQYFFCNRRCKSKWLGKTYGFGRYPKNAGRRSKAPDFSPRFGLGLDFNGKKYMERRLLNASYQKDNLETKTIRNVDEELLKQARKAAIDKGINLGTLLEVKH